MPRENNLNFSIVIPLKTVNKYLEENIHHIQNLEFQDWEAIVISDQIEENPWIDDSRIKMFSSGAVGPAKKRDLGVRESSGDVIVFLDDDSYPSQNLLSVLKKGFENLEVAAIGGPGITPESNTNLQKISGAVFLSKFTGGNPERYIPVGLICEVDDWPTVNFAIRRSVFLSVGGFNSKYWPGEDTEFCLKLKEQNYKIFYFPTAVVWHHRREGLARHLRQIGNYGLHRGYFARHLPGNSLKIRYFLPSIVSLLFITSPLKYLFSQIDVFWNVGYSMYAIAIALGVLDITQKTNLKLAILAVPYIVSTHFWYGLKFIRGFFMTTPLVSKLR
jgi:cellulose synthase/poly-beta-1,6-N-acetylglucosamine synthase-like glycosyltransferase